jgi:hypothetical protein
MYTRCTLYSCAPFKPSLLFVRRVGSLTRPTQRRTKCIYIISYGGGTTSPTYIEVGANNRSPQTGEGGDRKANSQLPCQPPFQPLISGASCHLFYREQVSPRQINAARSWLLTCWEMPPKIHVVLLCHQTSPDTSANLELQHLTGGS